MEQKVKERRVEQVGVLAVLDDGQLVAIVVKNGENILYKTDKMSFEEIERLLAKNL